LKQSFPNLRHFWYVGDLRPSFFDDLDAPGSFTVAFSPLYYYTYLAYRLGSSSTEEEDNALLLSRKQPGAPDWAIHEPDLYPVAFTTPLQLALLTILTEKEAQPSDTQRMWALLAPRPGFRPPMACLHLHTPRAGIFFCSMPLTRSTLRF
jgi:hypothetical protein